LENVGLWFGRNVVPAFGCSVSFRPNTESNYSLYPKTTKHYTKPFSKEVSRERGEVIVTAKVVQIVVRGVVHEVFKQCPTLVQTLSKSLAEPSFQRGNEAYSSPNCFF